MARYVCLALGARAAMAGASSCSAKTGACFEDGQSALQARLSVLDDAAEVVAGNRTWSGPKRVTREQLMGRRFIRRTDTSEPLPGGDLDPRKIPKYVTPLMILPAMKSSDDDGFHFDIELRQFQQQILPGGIWNNPEFGLVEEGKGYKFPPTTVWSYGPRGDPMPDSSSMGGGREVAPAANSQFSYPAYTVETKKDKVTKVRWTNGLMRDPHKCRECREHLRMCLERCLSCEKCDKCKAKCEKQFKFCDKDNCEFLPHLFAVDQALQWANPNQLPCKNTKRTKDCKVVGTALPQSRPDVLAPYDGPVPMVVHVHGAHADPESDGYPEAWYLPNASGIPKGYAMEGTFVNQYHQKTNYAPGEAWYRYRNDQPSAALWFHDNTLGISRLNVHAGTVGMWLIRDETAVSGETGVNYGTLPGPAPLPGDGLKETNMPGGREKYREIPLVIQDRSFNKDGSLFYPDDREFFSYPKTVDIPFIGEMGEADIAAVWNPELFFNTMVVNGNSWPALKVRRGLYSFRMLNGCNSRFLNLYLTTMRQGKEDQEVPFYQIGGDQGILPKVVKVLRGHKIPLPGDGTEPDGSKDTETGEAEGLLLAPGERAFVIVDFSALPAATVVRLRNTGPDGPFSGFPVEMVANHETTGQVMEFHVYGDDLDPWSEDTTHPNRLRLSLPDALDPANTGPAEGGPRHMALLEEASSKICVLEDRRKIYNDETARPVDEDTCVKKKSGKQAKSLPFTPKAVLLGVDGDQGGEGQLWMEKISVNPDVDSTEVWKIWNWSPQAYPVHLHLAKFKVLERWEFDEAEGILSPSKFFPQPAELGWKDTAIAYPFEVLVIRARFDIKGLYMWQCHILELRDNEMMMPYCVGEDDKACNLHDKLSASHKDSQLSPY